MTEIPKHLSAEAKSWFKKIATEYDLDDQAGLLLLTTAMEAFTRMRQVQAAILNDGPMVKDRFGQDRPHPLLATEKDSRSQMLQSLKQLNLDLEPLKEMGGRR